MAVVRGRSNRQATKTAKSRSAKTRSAKTQAERDRRKAIRDARRAKREHRRKLFAVREPSAIEYLAALADPDGPAAERVALWAERQAKMEGVLDYLTGFGDE